MTLALKPVTTGWTPDEWEPGDVVLDTVMAHHPTWAVYYRDVFVGWVSGCDGEWGSQAAYERDTSPGRMTYRSPTRRAVVGDLVGAARLAEVV